MKKTCILLLLTLCGASLLHAEPVSRDRAMQSAKAFLAKRSLKSDGTLTMAYQGQRRMATPSATAQAPCYYVFNNGQNGGFVVVSGDDCTEEILGYADRGSFDVSQIPENMQVWLDGYAEQIAHARANGVKKVAKAAANDDVARQVIAPMVTAHWNQSQPYYNQCPLYTFSNGTQQRCVTGCVATAFAQVMHYHKWPQTATTEVPGYKPNVWVGELDALPAITFDWDNMNDVYTVMENEPVEQRDAVAWLLRYCGQAVYMGYGPNASSASTAYIPNALKNYFGYDNEAVEVSRSKYDTEEWTELIYQELRHARPVIYSAATSSGSGHAFVCDGYDGHDLFHINWGWGGMSDGYFRLQALNPNTQGTGGSSDYGGYSMRQAAVIGISPTEVEAADAQEGPGVKCVYLRLKGSESATATFSSSNGLGYKSLEYSYQRTNSLSKYDYGIGLFQDDVLVDASSWGTLENDYTWSGSGLSAGGLGKGVADGHYTIRMVDRVTGTETWYPSVNSDLCYIDVEISGNTATLTNVEKTIEADLEVTNVEQRFDRGQNPLQLRAYLRNNGLKAFSGNIFLFVDDDLYAFECLNLAAGDDDYVDLFFDASVGEHKVALSANSSGTPALYTNENFNISGGEALPALTVVSTQHRYVSGSNQYGRLMEIALTVKNSSSKDYIGQFKKSMRSRISPTSPSYSVFNQLVDVEVLAGETKTLVFTHDLALGDVYWIIIEDANGNNLYEKFGLTVQPAFVTWTADGQRNAEPVTASLTVPDDALAVSLEDVDDLSTVTITPNANPNTLYYIAHDATIPASLSGKNVVRGYESGDIALVEGHDFYVPQSFTASNVSYTRTPTVGADGKNGWQTITLPFQVQQATSDGKRVDWFHSSTEQEKDFWLREFTRVSDQTVKFADVDTWMPNTPYIIAIQGDHWGKEYDMTGKPLCLSASNVLVVQTPVCEVTSDDFRFVGTTMKTTAADAYVLNEKGNGFVLQPTANVKSTEAFFLKGTETGSSPANLLIGFDDPTGIRLSTTLADGKAVVYSAQGIKVATVDVIHGQPDMSSLPSGIYIIQGTKIAK